MKKMIISLMWILGIAILLSIILVHNKIYLVCALIVGNFLAISSVALEQKYLKKQEGGDHHASIR